MKRILMIMLCASLSGCVSTLVTKEIQVKKDASGKVIETIETERIIQRGGTRGVQFDYLKSKQGDSSPAVIYY